MNYEPWYTIHFPVQQLANSTIAQFNNSKRTNPNHITHKDFKTKTDKNSICPIDL
jgi:hypothetical protein